MARLVALLLVLPLPCFANEPALRGPREVACGERVVLDASAFEAEAFSWRVDVSDVDVPPDRDAETLRRKVEELRAAGYTVQEPVDENRALWEELDDGRRLWIASFPGTWRVTLAWAKHAEDGTLVVGQAGTTITVEPCGTPPEDEPPDEDPPGDDPDDDDDPPKVDLDLSAEAAEWITLVPVEVREARVDPELVGGRELTRQQALGESFVDIGEAAEKAGSIAAVDALLTVALAHAFGKDVDRWRPFVAKADAALEALQAREVTVAQYGEALVSIGEALSR